MVQGRAGFKCADLCFQTAPSLHCSTNLPPLTPTPPPAPGDYSRVADRHMPPADLPEQRPHVLIVESTYGVSRHLPREEREQRFVERIHTAVGARATVV